MQTDRWLPSLVAQSVEIHVSEDEIQIVETVVWGKRPKGLLD